MSVKKQAMKRYLKYNIAVGDYGRPTQLDPAVILTHNTTALKQLSVGESVEFWQAGEVVLIGTGHPLSYRVAVEKQNYIEDADGTQASGVITMARKGHLRDPGEISVTGVQGRKQFQETVWAVTKKTIHYADDGARQEPFLI